jgi:hypothetical protein
LQLYEIGRNSDLKMVYAVESRLKQSYKIHFGISYVCFISFVFSLLSVL